MPLKKAFVLSVLLSLLKLIAYTTSNSAIVFASFIDSTTDSLVSYLNFIFYRRARQKPDTQHPFGHGGFEVVSSLIQGIMMATLSLLLVYDTLNTWIHGDVLHAEMENLPWSIGILIISALAGYGIQAYLGAHERRLQAQNESSLSLSSDRAHYLSDFWTNGLGALGLLSVWYFQSETMDRALGLVGAAFLLRTAYPLIKSSLGHIMQTGVEPAMQEAMHELIVNTDPRVIGFHRLRTRRLGPSLFVDFHLKLPATISLHDAHELSEKVSDVIRTRYSNADILVHLDPDDFPDENEFE